MLDFFHKSATMTKKVTGVAKLKGAPVVHSRTPPHGVGKLRKIATFYNDKDAIKTVLLEVADTPESRRTGLMGRKKLSPICGMLFEGLSGGGYFWMKNCHIPLDVIFLDKQHAITKLYTMSVDDGDEHYNYDAGDVAAIELPEGFCKQWGLYRGGCTVEIRDIPGKDR